MGEGKSLHEMLQEMAPLDAYSVGFKRGYDAGCPQDGELAKLEAEVDALAAENAELRKLAADLARVMDRDGARQADHACAECVPYSDILVAGFRCAYHRAKEVLRAR